MSLDSSDPLDLAFPQESASPSTSTSTDPLDIAFPKTGTAAKAPKPNGPYDPDRPAIGDTAVNLAHQYASQVGHTILGGYKGAVALARTHDINQAAQAVQDEQAQAYQASPAENKTLSRAMAVSKGMFPMFDAVNNFQPLADKAADYSASLGAPPGVSTAIKSAPTLAALAGAGRGLFSEDAAAAKPFEDSQSMGAAHAGVDFSNADPDIQQAVAQLSPEDIAANRATLERHAEAQSLPVKIRLTAGQATGDPDILSDEMNNRGATGLSQHLNQQGQQLKDNLQALREQVGPDVFSTNPVEHGDTLIQAYKDKDAPIVADINQKYQALHDAAAKGGVDAPVDGVAFANNAQVALRKKLLSNDVPPSIRADLAGFASGEPMNFEDFESMRTKLAQEMRDNPSGNQRTAAGIIRQSLEDVPLKPEAAALKPLADTARAAAKARFDALREDPAYAAAVQDNITPDQFVNKFLTGNGATASRAQAAIMKANLADNPVAQQTMSVATIDELKKAAGVGPMGEGKFGQDRFNKRLETLRPKLNSLLPPDAAETATTLGKVARYIKEQPEGNVINNSGTLSGALAAGAGKIAKSYVNVKSGGLAGPVLDYAQNKLNEAALKTKLKNAIAPLAGVSPGNGP